MVGGGGGVAIKHVYPIYRSNIQCMKAWLKEYNQDDQYASFPAAHDNGHHRWTLRPPCCEGARSAWPCAKITSIRYTSFNRGEAAINVIAYSDIKWG